MASCQRTSPSRPRCRPARWLSPRSGRASSRPGQNDVAAGIHADSHAIIRERSPAAEEERATGWGAVGLEDLAHLATALPVGPGDGELARIVHRDRGLPLDTGVVAGHVDDAA